MTDSSLKIDEIDVKILWTMLEDAWTLGQEDRAIFEQLMDICRNYASAASCATRPVLFESMAMTIFLDKHKKINQLLKKLPAELSR